MLFVASEPTLTVLAVTTVCPHCPEQRTQKLRLSLQRTSAVLLQSLSLKVVGGKVLGPDGNRAVCLSVSVSLCLSLSVSLSVHARSR